MKAPVFVISGFSDFCINLYWRELPSTEICSNTFLFAATGLLIPFRKQELYAGQPLLKIL
jgi:hypothetical protein